MKEMLKEDIVSIIDSIVHNFRVNESKKAFEQFDELIQNLEHYMISIKNNKNNIQNINEFLEELLNVIANKDYVMACDILKYGIKPLISITLFE